MWSWEASTGSCSRELTRLTPQHGPSRISWDQPPGRRIMELVGNEVEGVALLKAKESRPGSRKEETLSPRDLRKAAWSKPGRKQQMGSLQNGTENRPCVWNRQAVVGMPLFIGPTLRLHLCSPLKYCDRLSSVVVSTVDMMDCSGEGIQSRRDGVWDWECMVSASGDHFSY